MTTDQLSIVRFDIEWNGGFLSTFDTSDRIDEQWMKWIVFRVAFFPIIYVVYRNKRHTFYLQRMLTSAYYTV